jgi:hypothetical protein
VVRDLDEAAERIEQILRGNGDGKSAGDREAAVLRRFRVHMLGSILRKEQVPRECAGDILAAAAAVASALAMAGTCSCAAMAAGQRE